MPGSMPLPHGVWDEIMVQDNGLADRYWGKNDPPNGLMVSQFLKCVERWLTSSVES